MMGQQEHCVVLPGFVLTLFPEITTEAGNSLWIWECHHLPALCSAPQRPCVTVPCPAAFSRVFDNLM